MNDIDKDLLDLGSDPVGEDFDPFAGDDESDDETPVEISQDVDTEASAQEESTHKTSASTDTPADTAGKDTTADTKAPSEKNAEKPPVFEYAGATENIDDTSKTFDELRIEKSSDFPELEDGKRVSWTVEYGKISKTVADPKGMSIGKMKSDIETSKEFEDSLKKRGADKNPTCKVKPRVTAQSKGNASAYKGVFVNAEDAVASGKIISIIPARDGKVYEIRNTEMGKFITPITGSEMLSVVRAGFIPALPLIPMDLMMRIIAFFRYFMCNGNEQEVLVNVYWDKQNREYIVDAPQQTVTKVSVNSKTNDDYPIDRYIHYMDIHSHNSMKAFFSPTDDSDERATRLYSVIGRMDQYFPNIKTRISNGGKFHEIEPAEVFELVARPFPDEWKNNVHFRASHEVNNENGFKRPADSVYLPSANTLPSVAPDFFPVQGDTL